MRYFTAFLLTALSLFAQQPDVSRGPIAFAGAVSDSAIWVAAGGPNGAVTWRLTYHVDGTLFTAAQVAIQGANAATSAGCATAAWATITTANADVVESVNPSVSAAQGNVAVKSFYPCIRMIVTAVTGAGGTVSATIEGWKSGFIFPTPFVFAPAGTQNVNLVQVNGVTPDICTLKAVASGATLVTGNTLLVALSGTTTIRVCKVSFTTDTLTTFQLVTGTNVKAPCDTGATNETGVYSGAGGGLFGVLEDYPSPLITTAAKDLCLKLSAGVTTTGGITVEYSQR